METKTTRKRRSREPIAGLFLALPHSVLFSAQFLGLKPMAIKLLILIGMQHTGRNNGALVATPKYLRKLGWTSNDTLTRSLEELLDSGLLLKTRHGWRPNRAAWFALTWMRLETTKQLDINPANYRRFCPNPVTIPTHGIARNPVAPAGGIAASTPAPPAGAMRH